MAKNKTEFTNSDVTNFIEAIDDEIKRDDSYYLIKLMESVTGEPPKMYGPTIIGFGEYHYKYASGHEGKAPLLGFSPRKSAISLYVFTGLDIHSHLLKDLGKFKMGKACIYAKKMADINEEPLVILMNESIAYLTEKYTRIK